MANGSQNRPSKINRNDESGRYVETYPTDAFLSALETEGGSAGTSAVAQSVGCSYETAYKRLNELESTGKITRREVGNVYLWVIDDE